MIEIYTDGACKDRQGGWAALIQQETQRRALSGKASDTTNNRMELAAAIEALESVPRGAEVTIHSDSEYLVKSMTLGWKRNANLDLWERMDALANEQRTHWEWVKGHEGNPGNEFVNALAEFEAGVRKDRPRLERYLDSRPEQAPPEQSLTHVDVEGKARMVDVGWKPDTERVAVAKGTVVMTLETLALVKSNALEKGDVLGVARIAGIMAAKSTSQLIPLCHPLPLTHLAVDFALDHGSSAIDITATARTTAKTGVEMEAMTAVTVAALTIYDMCKGVDRGMRIDQVRLVNKSGGKSGSWTAE